MTTKTDQSDSRALPLPAFLALIFVLCLGACAEKEAAPPSVYDDVDQLFDKVVNASGGYQAVTSIDHSRLAAKAGSTMPPSRVYLFSDPAINTAILQQAPLAGLDLPFKVLVYAEGDTATAIYTDAEFIRRRHGLEASAALESYDREIQGVLDALPPERIERIDSAAVTPGYGMTTLQSQHSFDDTIQRLQKTIMAEGDTVWFGEIDYQSEASSLGEALPRLTLLLFGGPGPGGKAMAEYPRMGVDAFCQKVLVRELPDGKVEVYFNQMPAFATLHHNDKALPHIVINYRMTQTLKGGIE